MSWLNKIKPVTLYQSSDLPYVIMENGVRLCFDNFYALREEKSDFNIVFQTHRNSLIRQSANYYRFKEFPTIIPFDNILKLDNTVIKGHLLKHARVLNKEPISVSLIKSSYIDNMDDEKLSDFADSLEEYTKNFILVTDDDLTSQTRLLEDISEIIRHTDYYRTCVSMSHSVCPLKNRKYGWTQSVPDLSLDCYGLSDSEEKDHINDALDYIGITNFEINWED